jgi:uncharacterized protein YjbI with pentapeptide repeats
MAQQTEVSGSTTDGSQQESRRLAPRLWRWSPRGAAEVLAALLTVAAIITSAGRYLAEADDRHQRTVDEAWQVITSAQGQAGSGGRLSALEFLNEEDESLVGVSVKGAFLNNLDLEGAELNWANFQETGLDGANFQDAQLWKANFNHAYLGPSYDEEGNFDRKANLDRAFLDEADLRGAYLNEAFLRNTDLNFANLQGAVLDGAQLQEAKLGEANLQQASLRGANLQDADLAGANLEDADIRGADLRGAKNLGIDQLGQAIGNQHTLLSGIKRPLSWEQGTEIPLSMPEDPPLQPQEYSSKAFEPDMYFTVGEGWRASSDLHDKVALYHGYTSASAHHEVGFLNVQEVFDPSNPTDDLRRISADNVLPPPDNMALWLQQHPYLDAEESGQKSIDGIPAVQLDVVVSSTPSNYPSNCPRSCVPLFRDSQGGWWSLFEDYKSRMMILDVEGETVVFSMECPIEETDEFFPMAERVVQSVRWRDTES